MDQLVKLLKVLADETRLKIIHLLLTKTLCVGALAKQLGLSEAAVSQHLQILRKNGLVKGEKRGYFTHYIVEKELLVQISENIKQLAFQTPQTHINNQNECDCPHLK